jgi:hypothetical protein
MGVGLQGSVGANDWVCADVNCGNVNYGFRIVCNKCALPKPAAEETAAETPVAGTSPSTTTGTAAVAADTGLALGGVAEHTSTATGRKRPNLDTDNCGAETSATCESSESAATLACSDVSSECKRDAGSGSDEQETASAKRLKSDE